MDLLDTSLSQNSTVYYVLIHIPANFPKKKNVYSEYEVMVYLISLDYQYNILFILIFNIFFNTFNKMLV